MAPDPTQYFVLSAASDLFFDQYEPACDTPMVYVSGGVFTEEEQRHQAI